MMLIVQNYTLKKTEHNAASDDERCGEILFKAQADDDTDQNYHTYRVQTLDVSAGAEKALVTFNSMESGTLTNVLSFNGSRVGVGTASPASPFSVLSSHVGFAMRIDTDGNNANNQGIEMLIGTNDASGTNTQINFKDGDGGSIGTITHTGSTVTYGAFTANHDVELPEADNENGYPYGTLVEHTEIFYKQKNGEDTERGILYKVRKSSSAYSKSVLGAYATKYPAEIEGWENLHQTYILGDGHILCNNEKGNISIGDGICTSSTDGQGMKADKTSMIIGIAQKNISFSNSEPKLVPVQYGLQQFTPWED